MLLLLAPAAPPLVLSCLVRRLVSPDGPLLPGCCLGAWPRKHRITAGGGENRSDAARLGVILEYVSGWLRPQENHVLAVPPPQMRTLRPRLQELLGYDVRASQASRGCRKGSTPTANLKRRVRVAAVGERGAKGSKE